MYLFLDESGDLGFKTDSSKWFLFTLVIIDDNRSLERVIKKERKNLKKKYQKSFSELHAYHCDDLTRKRVLKSLSELNISIVTTVLNKQKVYIDFQNQKNYLYNYSANILLERLINKNIIRDDEVLDLVVDRKDTKKNLKNNFINYITEGMNNRRKGNFKMQLSKSHEDKGLQAVDFLSWAIFRKYEKGDFEFYEIIKDKIIEENLLFP